MALTPAELDQISKDYKVIATVLEAFTFVAPVELDDCLTVQKTLAVNLPKGYRVEVYHRVKDVIVEIRKPEALRPFYTRTLLVKV